MIPSPFAFYAPSRLDEAVRLLQQYGDEAKLLAGGHSLLPTMKLRLATPAVLIDLHKISDLVGVTVGERVTIGSMTTWSALEADATLCEALPVLAATIRLIGDRQVRNRGTLGGALAHADPAADAPAVVLVLNGTLTIYGPAGIRTIAADDFFVDMLTTALAPDEILTAITLDRVGPGEGAAYLKFAHPASRYALVGVAAFLRVEAGQVSACRVAVTGAGVRAERLTNVEAMLLHQPAQPDLFARAARGAADTLEILGDLHASETYRRAMVEVYIHRALVAAAASLRAS
ncbi:xanthine dehydrogenase family protein subunit M [Candidatus Chloroploca sp. M-50]|uniref:Xanthine dehydrogenase family protein subunit M n=1 Tax=Candidatus Chloroploca mongolica TaxID=2528176 RepID=A0ABS4D6D5_9CHLR|nr:xanthine dehydrogenase family protein subunit M [Candidatus Chloroploca mongolica]MBP1465007.1 xanthine dehydrogenase family protein subunit M [Candidatus Chloroploca mongolica]